MQRRDLTSLGGVELPGDDTVMAASYGAQPASLSLKQRHGCEMYFMFHFEGAFQTTVSHCSFHFEGEDGDVDIKVSGINRTAATEWVEFGNTGTSSMRFDKMPHASPGYLAFAIFLFLFFFPLQKSIKTAKSGREKRRRIRISISSQAKKISACGGH